MDRRVSRAGSGVAGCALPGLTRLCRCAARRPGQVSLCGAARARLELKPSFSLRGVGSPARDTEDPCLIFRYRWHSRNLLLTPQDHQFLLLHDRCLETRFYTPSSNPSPKEGLNKQSLEQSLEVVFCPVSASPGWCPGTIHHVSVWAPPPLTAAENGEETLAFRHHSTEYFNILCEAKWFWYRWKWGAASTLIYKMCQRLFSDPEANSYCKDHVHTDSLPFPPKRGAAASLPSGNHLWPVITFRQEWKNPRLKLCSLF